MSPTTYLIALPVSIIAVSGWMVKMENDQFLNRQRSGHAVDLTKVVPHPGDYAHGTHHAARLDHARYGQSEDSFGSLGETPSRRPIGSRASTQPSNWLDYQSITPTNIELPDIPGYIPAPTLPEPHFQTVPAESGYHITADEATKVDMAGQTVIFNGNVTLISPQFRMSSNRLKVHMSDDKKSFHLAEADGNVHVQLTGVTDDKKYRGQSSHATFEPRKSKLTLTGWPRIQGQGQELIAAEASTKVYLYTESGKMDTQGRAQTRIAKNHVPAGSTNP